MNNIEQPCSVTAFYMPCRPRPTHLSRKSKK